MQLLFISVFLISIFNLVKSHPTNALNCTDRHSQVDVLFNEILGFGSVEQRFPENKTQLKDFCNNQQRLISTLNDYKEECLSISGSDRRKQIFTLAIHSLRHWNNRICGYSKLSNQLVASASCANAAANGYRRCMNGFTDLVRSSRVQGQSSEVQKATLCCAYHRTLECMREVGLGVQPTTCSEASVDVHQQYVHLLVGGSVEVVCVAYDEVTDRCDRLVWSKMGAQKLSFKKGGKKEAKKFWKKKMEAWKFTSNYHQQNEIVQLKPFFNLMLDTLSLRT